MKIEIKSPTRVDLAGGTLDCWPLFLLNGSAVTLNLSMDIFTYATLEERDGGVIDLDIVDLDYRKEFKSYAELLASKDKEVHLLREVIRYFQPDRGFYLRTKSESPVGGGLGGSSSLTISLLKAFAQWLKKDWSVDEMVNVAHNIEAKVLRTPTGTQDYIPAASHGLNVIQYDVEGPKFSLLDVPLDVFSENMLLVYTGVPHHSGINNWQVIQAAISGDEKTLSGLRALSEIAEDMLVELEQKNWQALPALFEREYIERSSLSSSFTNPHIEKLNTIVRGAGAQALKICGAGGGGCVMVWAPAEHHQEVREQCQKNGYQVLDAQPVKSLPG